MKPRTIILLKISVYLIIIPILGLCILGLPWLANRLAEVYPVSVFLQYPSLISLYAAWIPFSMIMLQVIKLFRYLVINEIYSEPSVKAVKNIKYSAAAIFILYMIGMPLLYLMADKDDAPGFLALGLLVNLAFAVTAILAHLLQKKWQGYVVR